MTGNEDGAHHCIAQMAQRLIDIGWTVPGQAWTYWSKGPEPGPSYLETDEGHEWSKTTGQTAAEFRDRGAGAGGAPDAGSRALRKREVRRRGWGTATTP